MVDVNTDILNRSKRFGAPLGEGVGEEEEEEEEARSPY